MQMGFGLWHSCGGQISILGQWCNSHAGGLAPRNGPGHTRCVNRRLRRSPIGAVQGLLGWEETVLRQMHMGQGLWQSCGWQISILGQCGNSLTKGLSPSLGPGHTWVARRGQRRFPIRAVKGLLVWVK